MAVKQEDPFWAAVENRNRGFDGSFVYAVQSTGIYCRPSCGSRRPKRENVVFFPLPETAEQAGYRACRKCKPETAEILNPELAIVQKACRFMHENGDEKVSLEYLSKCLNVSPFHLQRTFKRVLGISPREYMDERRVQNFKSELRSGKPVTYAMYEAGYGSASRLYEQTAWRLGMTPSGYQRGGKGMQIRYTILNSPLGRLLVGATERGLCAVTLGESDSQLENQLRKEYPEAAIDRDHASIENWVTPILDRLRGVRTDLDLPIDVIATAFQRRVWEELRKIPYGATRSYADIARAVGNPKATRAVAHACAVNRVAVVIPCHRVVREGGALGGYRWGIERKQKLIQQEANVQTTATRSDIQRKSPEPRRSQ